MNYMLINKMVVKPGKRQAVIDILLKAGEPFKANPACLLYLVSTDQNNADVLWVQDVWTDKSSHEAAMQTEAMMQYIKQAMPLLGGMPEQYGIEPVGGKCDWL